MRVLHTESSLNWGGQEYRILEQCVWLNQKGHQSYLAAPERSEIMKRACALGLAVLPLPFSSTFDLKSICTLRHFVRHHRIEVIDAHGAKDADAAGFCQSLCGVVRSLHVYRPLKSKIMRKWRWRFLNHRVVATAHIIREQLAHLGYKPLDSIDVIGEWASGDFFAAASQKKENRKKFCLELGCSSEGPLYGNIGMLRKDKGQHTFLEIAHSFQEKNLPGLFLVMGDAPLSQKEYASTLKQFVEERALHQRVRFLGYRPDAAEIMSALDAVLLCSHTVEAQSRIVPQAFAVKTPIVASRVGGVPELVKNKETGLLVDIGDTEAYVDALRLFQNENELKNKIVDRAHHFAQVHLTLEEKMQETLRSYEKVLKASPL